MSDDITAITMPKWGLTMTEGKVVGWLKQAGDRIAAGDELLEIETSKITNVFEAPRSGILRRVVASEGSTLPIGGLLAVVAPEAVSDGEINAFIAGFKAPEPTTERVSSEAGPRDIDAGGKRLRVLDLGGGDALPVLLIHGFGADLNGWMFTQPALAEQRRAVALDLPGHGGSEKKLDGAAAESFAAAIDRALEALGIERTHLVGHSMGGAVALTFALQRPARVASLSLIAPAQLGPEINADFIEGFLKAQRRREMQQVLTLLVHDPALVSRQMVEDVLRYKRLDGAQAALEAIAEEWFPNGVQRVAQAALLESLDMSVQLIWGRDDRIIPVGHAEVFAGRLPVHILEEAGHLPHMEKAGEVNRLIAQFIAGS